jgi:hypothetical protein
LLRNSCIRPTNTKCGAGDAKLDHKVISTLEERQEDHGLQINLGYIVRPYLKKTKKSMFSLYT